MNILIASRNGEILKEYSDAFERGHPHFVTDKHLREIERVLGKKGSVVVARSMQEALSHLADVEVIAGFPHTIPDTSSAPRVRWIHSFSAGVERILTPFVLDSKIIVSNSSGIHAIPIAEHIIAFLLMFTRGLYRTFQNQEKHSWQKDEFIGELRGKRVLIVGAGEIGIETARILHTFGAEVSAVTRSAKQKSKFIKNLGGPSDLDAMLPDADFVLIALPYTRETHHLFNEEKFRLMNKNAVIINIGRGSIIHENHLVAALRKKQIFGAALDVTEEEPLPRTSPLWDLKNVIITPHHSGLSDQYMNRAIQLFSRNLQAYMSRKPLPTQVDKELGY